MNDIEVVIKRSNNRQTIVVFGDEGLLKINNHTNINKDDVLDVLTIFINLCRICLIKVNK